MFSGVVIATLAIACISAAPENYYSNNQGGQGGGRRPIGGGQGGGSSFSSGQGSIRPSRPSGGQTESSSFSGGSSFSGDSHQPFIGGPVVPIISDNREGPLDGVYSFDFQTGDGISRQEQGSPTGPNGAVAQQGSWSFTFPDGAPAQFSFVADEGGYKVESPLIPTPHPLPAHAVEQILKAERERAQGIIHDGQYRPEDHQGGGGGSRSSQQPQRFAQQQQQPQRFSQQQQPQRQSNRQQRQYYN